MSKPLVILLHGIFRTQWSLTFYELYLRWQGYDTLNITYPSMKHDLARLAQIVGDRMSASPKVQAAPEIHFLTHSMGGLITRYILATHPALRAKTKHIVMLVPPNQGSEVADYLFEGGWMKPIYEFLSGPAGPQMITSYAARYPAIEGTIGIIAGNRSSNPFARKAFTADQKHDGTISHERMKLAGVTEIEEVRASHTSILCSPAAMRKAGAFIRTGTFSPPTLPAAP